MRLSGPLTDEQSAGGSTHIRLPTTSQCCGRICGHVLHGSGEAAERIGTDIEPGRYQCKDPGELVYWATSDQSGELLDNDIGSIARVTSSAYAIKLDNCNVDWKRAG